METIKKYVVNYIRFYLENDDELTEKNEYIYNQFLNNGEIIEEIAHKIGEMKLVDIQDINYEIGKLLNEKVKEITIND